MLSILHVSFVFGLIYNVIHLFRIPFNLNKLSALATKKQPFYTMYLVFFPHYVNMVVVLNLFLVLKS